jgi:hypothetical protein
MGQISIGNAIQAAETDAANHWGWVRAVGGNNVHNCGTDDYIDSTLVDLLIDNWLNRGNLNGFQRRACISSGEAKVDLKFAHPNDAHSSFNFHVKFRVVARRPDPVVRDSQTEAERIMNNLRKAEWDQRPPSAKRGGYQPLAINWNNVPVE